MLLEPSLWVAEAFHIKRFFPENMSNVLKVMGLLRIPFLKCTVHMFVHHPIEAGD